MALSHSTPSITTINSLLSHRWFLGDSSWWCFKWWQTIFTLESYERIGLWRSHSWRQTKMQRIFFKVAQLAIPTLKDCAVDLSPSFLFWVLEIVSKHPPSYILIGAWGYGSGSCISWTSCSAQEIGATPESRVGTPVPMSHVPGLYGRIVQYIER